MFPTDEEKGEDGLQDSLGPGPVVQKLLWRKVESLGRGGFGTANLWILYDTTVGNIIERVVVKEGFGPLSDPRADRFIEPPGSGKWVAGEGILHKRMTTARQKYSAIPYHHATLAYGRVMRLYLEYALFGDLDKYGAHFRNGLIDEGFVWNVLHSLVSNLKTMHEGNGTRDWEPFVHRDIKGANVLVVNARDKQSKKLNVPTPVLNDYGLARRLPDHSPMDVAECVVWDKIGTPGYCAPESMHPEYAVIVADDLEPAEPSSAVDIYSVGCTIHTLMQPESNDRTLWYYDYFEQQRELQAHLVDNLEMHDEYSDELKSIVRRCLKYRPSERIGLDALCNHTKQGRHEYFAKTSRPWPHFPNPLHTYARAEGKKVWDDTAVGEKVGALNLDRKVDHADIVHEPFFDKYRQKLIENVEQEEEKEEDEDDDDVDMDEDNDDDDVDEDDDDNEDNDDDNGDNDDDNDGRGSNRRDANDKNGDVEDDDGSDEDDDDDDEDDDDDVDGPARRARDRAAFRLRQAREIRQARQELQALKERRALEERQAFLERQSLLERQASQARTDDVSDVIDDNPDVADDVPDVAYNISDVADDDLYGMTPQPPSSHDGATLPAQVGQRDPPPRGMRPGPAKQSNAPPRRIPGPLQGGRIPAGGLNASRFGRDIPPPLSSRLFEQQEQSPPAYEPGSLPKLPSPTYAPPPPQITYAPNSPKYAPASPAFAPAPAVFDYATLPNAPEPSPVHRPTSTRVPLPRLSEDLPDVPTASPANAKGSNSSRRASSRQFSSPPPSVGGSAERQETVSRSKSKSKSPPDKQRSKTRTPTLALQETDKPQEDEQEEPSAAPQAPTAAQQQNPAPHRRQRAATPVTAASARPRRARSEPVRYGEWVSGTRTRKRKNDDGADGDAGAGRKRRK